MATKGQHPDPGYPRLREMNELLFQRVLARSTYGEEPEVQVLQTQVLDPADLDKCIGVTRKDLKEVEQRLERAEMRIQELEREKQPTGLIVVPEEVQNNVWHHNGAVIDLRSK